MSTKFKNVFKYNIPKSIVHKSFKNNERLSKVTKFWGVVEGGEEDGEKTNQPSRK